VEDAVEAGFVAVDEVQVRGGGERGESAGDAHDLVAGGLSGDAGVEKLGLDAPDAARAPVGYGHFLDDAGFNSGDGVEAIAEVLDELAEDHGVLVFEDDLASRAHAVTEGVAGSCACLRHGTAGAGAVGPRRFDAPL
jgi:hypothetical protein